jgi:hypothetical protein
MVVSLAIIGTFLVGVAFGAFIAVIAIMNADKRP